jgi:hypothetical protein
MSSAWLFGMIVFYPIVSVLITRFLGISDPVLAQLKNEYYLWFGFTLVYVGAIVLFFSGTSVILNSILSYLVYTILYFAIAIARKTIFTADVDIFAKLQGKS